VVDPLAPRRAVPADELALLLSELELPGASRVRRDPLGRLDLVMLDHEGWLLVR